MVRLERNVMYAVKVHTQTVRREKSIFYGNISGETEASPLERDNK